MPVAAFRPAVPEHARAGLACGVAVLALLAARAAADDSQLAAYSTTIRPLLAARCFSCHGGLEQKSGLRLDTASLMTQGGESGAAVVKGDPGKSLILARVSDPDPATRMPPQGEGEPLSADEVALLRDWIAAGCPAPADERPEADPRDHWAFQPRVRPAVPPLDAATGIRNPIDAFLAAARAKAGVTPQPEAPRHVLVRRVFIDLIGLPPQPEELAAIEADTSPDWYEKLVDRLLADPRHGERWARHWMDVWRYSDWWGLGEQHRNSQKHMWHFRDWIVESLNADTGYDEMVRQMLAADELHPDDPAKLRATGFLARNWFLFNRTPWLDDTVEHVGKALLGLTLNCSKCHAHKYDPVSQEDYYRFRAFFEPIETRLDMVAGEADLEKDGIPRVFDGHPDRPTHLLVRGEDTKPDTSRSFAPGVPAILAGEGAPRGDLAIEAVPLPKTASEPERRPWVLDAHVATARRAVEAAEAAVAKAAAKEAAARTVLAGPQREATARAATVAAPASPSAGPASLAEDFATLDDSRWRLFGGDWRHEPGRLAQDKDGQTRAAARLLVTPPRDFDATVVFAITGGSTYRSVGLSFDATPADPARPHGADDGEVSIYASAWAAGPKVQASFVSKAAWQYPAAGHVRRPVSLSSRHTLRVAVRDTLVNVWFDDEPVIAWRSPVPRREGSLQLTTFDATAVFERFALAPLSDGLVLREPAAAEAPAAASPDVARAAVVAAERDSAAAAASLAVAKAAVESVVRRAEATRLGWEAGATDPEAAQRREEAARAAARGERGLVLAQARQKAFEIEARLATVTSDAKAADKKPGIEKELAAARDAVAKAEKGVDEADSKFTPLVGAKWVPTRFKGSGSDDPAVPFPSTSTGRRAALARWITDPRNPLASRVAVNHIWMRHFGRPLVPTVFEFGRKGVPPVHPELLDWLASELVEGPAGSGTVRGFGMKHLHRLICTSAAYRMGSSLKGAEAAVAADPDNTLLWRREPIRLESQVIRDAALALAGTLDPAIGGPPVREADQAGSRRRSLYFWHSEISRNVLLSTFDDPSVIECYRRDQSIVPQQALALSNAALVHDSAAAIAARIATGGTAADDAAFLDRAFTIVLHRRPSAEERQACLAAMEKWRAVEKPAGAGDVAQVRAVWALLNHNDFVTLR